VFLTCPPEPSESDTRLQLLAYNVTGLWCLQNFDANNTDTEILQNPFASYGSVKSAVLVKGQQGQSKAACYINFEDHESAKVWACMLSRKSKSILVNMSMRGAPVAGAKSLGSLQGQPVHMLAADSVLVFRPPYREPSHVYEW
jgi:hypothetical protein